MAKLKDEKIIELIGTDRDAAVSLQHHLAAERANYYKFYRCEPYGNERQGWASTIYPAIYNHLQGDLPSFLEIFESDFFTFKAIDTEKAQNMQKLVKAQMFRLQDGYKRFFEFFYNAELYHYAVFKVFKKDDYDVETEVLPSVDERQMALLAQNPDIVITKVTEEEVPAQVDQSGMEVSPAATRYTDVKIARKKTKFSGPALEVVPPWEFFYSPDCKIGDFGEISGKLVMHRVRRSLDYITFKEKSGIYRKGTVDKVKDLFKNAAERTREDQQVIQMEVDDIPQVDTGDVTQNELEREVEVDEIYFRADIDGDGLLEHVYAHLVNDIVMLVEENPYGRPCFRLGSISPEPHKLLGIPMPKLLDYDQRIMTNLLRLIQDSAAQSTYRNPVTNDAQMFKLLQNRKPFAVIKGDPQKLGEVKIDAPSQFVLKAWEMLKGEGEEKTGRTRYNQGLDANSLNKTATGISLISAASAKRIRMVAKLLGNGVFCGILRDFIFINKKWPPAQSLQMIGEFSINPQDLLGEYEVEVDVGVGPAEKQALANHVDLFVQWQLKAGIQLGLVRPEHVQKALIYKYQLLGVKVADFMVTPQELQQITLQKQREQQMLQKMQAQAALMGGQGGPAAGPNAGGPRGAVPNRGPGRANPQMAGGGRPVISGNLPPNTTGFGR